MKAERFGLFERQGERQNPGFSVRVHWRTALPCEHWPSARLQSPLWPAFPDRGWSVLKYDTNLGGYVVNLDKRQLEGAPGYDVGEEPAWGDRAYESKIHDY